MLAKSAFITSPSNILAEVTAPLAKSAFITSPSNILAEVTELSANLALVIAASLMFAVLILLDTQPLGAVLINNSSALPKVGSKVTGSAVVPLPVKGAEVSTSSCPHLNSLVPPSK